MALVRGVVCALLVWVLVVPMAVPASGSAPVTGGQGAPVSVPVGWVEPGEVAPASPPAAVAPPVVVSPASAGPTIIDDSVSLDKDMTWGPEGSPYIVSGYRLLTATLTILPGTVVQLAPGARLHTTIDLATFDEGQILAVGRPDARIVFTSTGEASGTAAPGDWGGIEVNRKPSVFDYVDFRYGGGDGSQLHMGHGHTVAHSTFSHSARAGTRMVLAPDGTVGIFDNEFHDSPVGVTGTGGWVLIEGNSFGASVEQAASLHQNRGVFRHNTVRTPKPPTFGYSEVHVTHNNLFTGLGAHPTGGAYGYNHYGNLPVPSTRCEDPTRYPWHFERPAVLLDDCPYVAQTRIAPDPGSLPYLDEPVGDVPPAMSAQRAPRWGSVDVGSGTLSFSTSDLVVTDAGAQLVASRVFRSDRTGSGDVGGGWSTQYGQRLMPAGQGATFTTSSGDEVPFQSTSDPVSGATGVAAPRGIDATVTSGAEGTTLTTPGGGALQFGGAGELVGIIEGDPDRRLQVAHDAGRVSQVTGVSGRWVRYGWQAGRLASVADSQGRTVDLGWSGGRLVSASRLDGGSETYEYDAAGRLTRVTGPAGVVRLAVGYDSEGRVSWVDEGMGRAEIAYLGPRRVVTLATGETVVFWVDAHGREIAQQRGESGSHTVYDAGGSPVVTVSGVAGHAVNGYAAQASAVLRAPGKRSVADRSGRWVQTTLDAAGRPLVTTYADGGTVTRTRDEKGRVTSVTDQTGGTWSFTYSDKGQVTSQTDPLGRVTRVGYSAAGDVVSVTDPYQAVTTSTVDALGRVVSTTDAVGATTTMTWSAGGLRTSVTTPVGRTVFEYRPDGLVTSVRRQSLDGSVTLTESVEYDPAGRVSALVAPGGGRTTFARDALGRVVAATGPAGGVERQTWSHEGWVSSVTNELGGTTTMSYLPDGRLLRTTDPFGAVTQYLSDGEGRVTSVFTPDGQTNTYDYDAVGRLSKHITPWGGRWTTFYDKAGRPVGEKDPTESISGGPAATTAYDAAGRVVATTTRSGIRRTWEYATDSRTVTVSDPLGVVETRTFDALDRLVTLSVPGSGTTSFAYDAVGNVTSVSGPAGTRTWTYDAFGRAVSGTDEAGRTTTWAYDADGNVVTTVAPGGATTRAGYDAAGNQTLLVDARGHRWETGRDAAGNAVSQTDPLGRVTTTERDLLGREVLATDPTGVRSGTAYDPMGRVAVTWDTLGSSWVSSYNREGNLAKVVDPAGITRTFDYDDRGLLTEEKVDDIIRRLTYDKDGRLVGETLHGSYQQERSATYAYDARGRVTSVTDGTGAVTATSYQVTATGTTVTTTSPAGRVSSVDYDLAGRVVSTTDPMGRTTSYAWTPDSQPESVTQPRGGVTRWAYDASGRVASVTDPEGRVTRHTWTPDGRPASVTRPSGRATGWDWDAAGRLVTRTSTMPGAADVVDTFGYDAAGRMVATASTAAPGADVSYAYNSRGQLVQQTDATGTTGYGWGRDARLRSVTTPAGVETTFGYDTNGTLRRVRGSTNLTLAYRADGQPSRIEPDYPSYGARQVWTYDAAGRPTSTTGTVAQSWTWDADGRLVGQRDDAAGQLPARTRELTYDDAGRVTGETSRDSAGTVVAQSSYEWDADGNRTRVSGDGADLTAVFDRSGRSVAGPGATVLATYDADGNVLTTHDGGSYSYDAAGRLVSIRDEAGTRTQTRDALGRLATVSGPQGVTSLSYQGPSGTVTGWATGEGFTGVTRGVDDQRLLAVDPPTQATTRLVTDPQRDVVASVTDSGGQVRAQRFDVFGVRDASGAVEASPFGFGSGWTNPASGAVETGAGTYLPSLAGYLDQGDGDVEPSAGGGAGLPQDDPLVARRLEERFESVLQVTGPLNPDPQTDAEGLPVAHSSTFVGFQPGGWAPSGGGGGGAGGGAPRLDPGRVAFNFLAGVADGFATGPLDLGTMVLRGLDHVTGRRVPMLGAGVAMAESVRKDITDFERSLGIDTDSAAFQAGQLLGGLIPGPGLMGRAAGLAVKGVAHLGAQVVKGGGRIGHQVASRLTDAAKLSRPAGRATRIEQPGLAGRADGVGSSTQRFQATDDAGRVAAPASPKPCDGQTCGIPGQKCFTAGTPVLLADGGSVPIEQVRVGDQVLTTDPDTGEETPRTVTATMATPDQPVWEVTLSDGSTVEATPTHPFWVQGKGWTPVDQVRPGDQLVTPDETTITVAAAVDTGERATVYNIEVEGAHSYYVNTGTHWVLVHNACYEPATRFVADNRGSIVDVGRSTQPTAADLADMAVAIQMRHRRFFVRQRYQTVAVGLRDDGMIFAASNSGAKFTRGQIRYMNSLGIQVVERARDERGFLLKGLLTALGKSRKGKGFPHAEENLRRAIGDRAVAVGITRKPCKNVCEPIFRKWDVEYAVAPVPEFR